VSSTLSHRERVLRFQARQLLVEQLRRSVEQIGNARDARDLPSENARNTQGEGARLVLTRSVSAASLASSKRTRRRVRT
jgi:hypothetical protein